MKKGYIAGKLFKQADQKQRIYEKEILKQYVPTVDFFNPLTDNPANDKSKLPNAHDIFINDTKKIIESDYIIAELDDEDSGVACEIGIAYGINYMREIIKMYKYSECSLDVVIDRILSLVPEKDVIAHLSDLRIGTSGEYNERYVPFGTNQYLLGCVEETGVVMSKFEDCANMVREIEQENIKLNFDNCGDIFNI